MECVPVNDSVTRLATNSPSANAERKGLVSSREEAAPRRPNRSLFPVQQHRSSISKILISWDIGTKHSRVKFWIVRHHDPSIQALDTRNLLAKAEVITMPDGLPYSRTQLAFDTSSRADEHAVPSWWGVDVDRELHAGNLTEDEVIQYDKVRLYTEGETVSLSQDDLRRKIMQNDPIMSSCVDDAASRLKLNHRVQDLWVAYQRHLYAYVLSKI